MYGMPAGFEELLRRKYEILGQNADANTINARSNANLNDVRARLLPKESAAGIAQTEASTEQTKAQTKGINIENAFRPRTLESQIGYNNALTFDARARGTNTNEQTRTMRSLNLNIPDRVPVRGAGFGSGLRAVSAYEDLQRGLQLGLPNLYDY